MKNAWPNWDRGGLRVSTYTFAGAPRVCRNVKTGRGVYLADLLYRTADHRLILFGEGERLVSEWGDLAPAVCILLRWRQRSILTPRRTGDWGPREYHLASQFLLLPATIESLAASVDHFDPDHGARLRRPGSEFSYRELDLDHATPQQIERVLGDRDLYLWLCACALYPQLQWDVTLHLGLQIDPGLLAEANLEKLVRLPCFRRGSMLVAVQQALAESLDESTRLRLRAAVLELFDEAPAAAGGTLAEAHRLEIAIQRLDILPEDRRGILDDDTVARVVAERDVPKLALPTSPALRKALFPHGLPALGFRFRARRAVALYAGAALACIAGLAVYSAVSQPSLRLGLEIHAPAPPPDWMPGPLKVLVPGEMRPNSRDGLEYVWIPPGKFMMGCSPGDSECMTRIPRTRCSILYQSPIAFTRYVMWTRKFQRDRKKGVDSPMPTQLVSNEELIPRRQTPEQKNVEHLIGELAGERSKRLGMERRDFMASSMGLATCFLASNMVYGKNWEVDETETYEADATAEKYPKGEYFIMDVQSHFTNGFPIKGFRGADFVKNMGFNLKEDADAYSYRNFVKEMFFDSDTEMVVISGVPGRERNKDDKGEPLEGRARGGGILPSWLMSQAGREINSVAGSTRAVWQGNLAPNHYWDRANNRPDKPALLEQMDRELNKYGIKSWKWYCHTDPGNSGGGFQLDDDNAQWFYDESRKRGLKTFSVHKGFSYQSRTLGHLANPKDVEKAALRNPDLNFIIYHSALQHGPNEPDWKTANEWNPETGDFAWHKILMDIKARNPKMTNVYPEVGSFFNVLAIADPVMCQHGIGKNIKHYGSDHVIWGTDCLWWGSPQWCIDAFKRFQITDELCDKFGYKKLTKGDKANIFGLNAAKLYGVDVKAKRNALPADALDRLKVAYHEQGGMRDNAAYGWVRADD